MNDAKKNRKIRAEIHAAMTEAEAKRKRERKGKAARDIMMRRLGFVRIGPDGQGLPPEQKWRKVEA